MFSLLYRGWSCSSNFDQGDVAPHSVSVACASVQCASVQSASVQRAVFLILSCFRSDQNERTSALFHSERVATGFTEPRRTQFHFQISPRKRQTLLHKRAHRQNTNTMFLHKFRAICRHKKTSTFIHMYVCVCACACMCACACAWVCMCVCTV